MSIESDHLIAAQYEQVAFADRQAALNIIVFTINQKISLIKDVTIFATAILGSIVAAFSVNKIQNYLLFAVSLFLLVISIILSFYSRYKYGNLAIKLSIDAENRYARDQSISITIQQGEKTKEKALPPLQLNDLSPESKKVFMGASFISVVVVLGLISGLLSLVVHE